MDSPSASRQFFVRLIDKGFRLARSFLDAISDVIMIIYPSPSDIPIYDTRSRVSILHGSLSEGLSLLKNF